MRKLKLTLGKFALVEDEDFEWLNQWKWTAEQKDYTFYARRNSKKKKVYLHRQIIGAKKGEVVDHINRDGLDNRRKNLRIVTPTQNNYNQKIRVDNTSGYKGIWWNRQRQKWVVEIWARKQKYYFGGYKNIQEAIVIRNNNYEELVKI